MRRGAAEHAIRFRCNDIKPPLHAHTLKKSSGCCLLDTIRCGNIPAPARFTPPTPSRGTGDEFEHRLRRPRPHTQSQAGSEGLVIRVPDVLSIAAAVMVVVLAIIHGLGCYARCEGKAVRGSIVSNLARAFFLSYSPPSSKNKKGSCPESG